MTKDDFANRLATSTDLSKAKAREVIDCIFGTHAGEGIIAAELDAGRDFPVTGFGRFATRNMKARSGRNPQSGDPIWISARTIPTFKPGQGLKNRVADQVAETAAQARSPEMDPPTLW